jgi:hypothetical protein
MTATLGSAMLPAWLVIPIAGITMLLIAGHVQAIQELEMPTRRRRIRTINGVLMIFATALMAYAVSIADSGRVVLSQPEAARHFVLTWGMITTLVGLIVLLAALDSLTTVQQHTKHRRALRARLRQSVEEAIGPRMATPGGGGAGRDDSRA